MIRVHAAAVRNIRTAAEGIYKANLVREFTIT